MAKPEVPLREMTPQQRHDQQRDGTSYNGHENRDAIGTKNLIIVPTGIDIAMSHVWGIKHNP